MLRPIRKTVSEQPVRLRLSPFMSHLHSCESRFITISVSCMYMYTCFFFQVLDMDQNKKKALVKWVSISSWYFSNVLNFLVLVTYIFNDLTHSHTMTPFDPLENKPFENTVGKGEIACNKQFLLSHSVFYPFG